MQAGPALKTSLGAPNGQVVVVNEVSADVMQDSVAIRFPAVIIGVMPYWWRERGGQRCLMNCLALRLEANICVWSGTPTRVAAPMDNWMPAGVLAGLCILSRPCWVGPHVLGATDAPYSYGCAERDSSTNHDHTVSAHRL